MLGLIGYFIRRGAHEPLDPEHGHEKSPIRRTLRQHRGRSLLGILSDRVGRKVISAFGMFGVALVAVPAVALLAGGNAMAARLMIAVPMAAAQAVLMVSLIERFPTRLRGTGFGLL